jgi:hypothetical protein
LPDNPAEDQIRTGERFYYSALNCYQTWLSCSSCHDEGRMDTLNWDLQNDGTGNPKQTKSHIYLKQNAANQRQRLPRECLGFRTRRIPKYRVPGSTRGPGAGDLRVHQTRWSPSPAPTWAPTAS